MQYIYCRVSTDGQTTDNQSFDLTKRYPDATVVTEIASGAKQRPQLDSLIASLERGDTLIVAALDRLGRKATNVLSLIEDLDGRGVTLVSVREGVDYSTPTGRLVTQILASVAEMERALISERTKAALAKAKDDGKNVGGKREGAGRKRVKYPVEEIERVLRYRRKGLSTREIAEITGYSASKVSMMQRRAR